jgi:hypothetical protein
LAPLVAEKIMFLSTSANERLAKVWDPTWVIPSNDFDLESFEKPETDTI